MGQPVPDALHGLKTRDTNFIPRKAVTNPTLSTYDYVVIAFYFAFMTMISWVFKRFIRNTSDYFRGGGEMLWWMTGAGAFMVSFSAVTFSGMAGKANSDGPVVMAIFVGTA